MLLLDGISEDVAARLERASPDQGPAGLAQLLRLGNSVSSRETSMLDRITKTLRKRS